MKHRSEGATALLGMPGFVVGAQLEVDGEIWLHVETTTETHRREAPPRTGLFSVDCGYISCTLYLDYEESQAYAVGVATLSSLVALAPEPVISKILAGAGYLSAGLAGVALSFGNCTSFRVSLTAFFGGAPVSQGFYDCG